MDVDSSLLLFFFSSVGLSTGNFAATDYPDQDVFPAYGTGGHWAKV